MNPLENLYKIVTEQAEQQSIITANILKKIETSDVASNKIFETIEDLYKNIAILQESQKELKKDTEKILKILLNLPRMN